MGAISFATPLLLGALVLLPGLWWLLRAMPPSPNKVAFGGMIFLEPLESRKETPSRTPWWMLLIRLGALALLILGLSGPVIGSQTDLDSEQPLLIIVDDSWPAAPRWTERQRVFRAMATSPGAAQRPARILTTSGTAELSEPLTLREAMTMMDGLAPKAALPDRASVLDRLEQDQLSDHVLWISDGVIGRRGADREFLRLLGETEELTLIRPAGQVTMAIRELSSNASGLTATIERISSNVDGGSLVATAADGRPLGEVAFNFEGATQTQVSLNLPILLRNEIARLRLAGQASAGATWLVDSRARRIRARIISDSSDNLLGGGFYIEQALLDHAVIDPGGLEDSLSEDISLLVLDDIAIIRPTMMDDILSWVRAGGTLIRFAGPKTSNAAGSTGPLRDPSYPVALRGGERAFGGALSWEAPQKVSAFPENSLFEDISVRQSVEVRRQVLTRSSTEPGYAIWASLEDGTPLVTARQEGDGRLILFHITATPTWSDLPTSGLFPALLSRIANSAADVPASAPRTPQAPFRLLDGFGGLQDPGVNALIASPENIAAGEAAPGLYGSAAAAYAVNTYGVNAPAIDPLSAGLLPSHAVIRGESGQNVREFGPTLIAIALLLIMTDALALMLRNRMQLAAAILMVSVITPMSFASANAQSLDLRPDIDSRAIAAALSVRLGYIETGDPATDRLTKAGLEGLTQVSIRRSALEPAPPVAVDIERQDLSVYPILYWVITPSTTIPSESALSALENFMADGGMLIIDTRDGERQTDFGETAEAALLRRILLRMNIPPLEPLPGDHILKKSFYLLDDLHGRNSGGPVWVEASGGLRESTDGVPSLIIGGRDWATAWAVDAEGMPLRSPGPGGELRREYAYRTGINMAMVALTGNYKEDQVHAQELLEKLGAEQ